MKIPAELLEKMAKAHRNHGEKGLPYGNPYTDKGLLEKMQAALDVLEAEGLVLIKAKDDKVAQKIIDYMGEYLEGNPLLIQENAVRYAVPKAIASVKGK